MSEKKTFTHELIVTVRVVAENDEVAHQQTSIALRSISGDIYAGDHKGSVASGKFGFAEFELKRLLPQDAAAEPIHHTDRLDITIKIDEPRVEAKIPAMLLKLGELTTSLTEVQTHLPAIPSGGGGSNDAGCLTYKITPNFAAVNNEQEATA